MSTAATTATPRRFYWTDVLSGVSVAGLLLPEALAYSNLAGLAPQAGVIGLFAGLLFYAALGRSRYAIVTATSSSAAVLAAATLTLGGTDPMLRAAIATVLVTGCGVAFLLAAGARLGSLSNLIARPVLHGFSFGLALTIVLKQLPHLAGIDVHAVNFYGLLLALAHSVGRFQLWSFAVGIVAVLALQALGRLREVPGALLVILLGIIAAPWLARHGVALTGHIALSLELPNFSAVKSGHWLATIEYAFALMFILAAESYGSIRTFALRHDEIGQPNRDLMALGCANLVSGIFNGTPVGAGYSATSANEAAGARSRASGVFAATAILAALFVFLPWIERIPEPVLAAIVIHAVSRSLNISSFRPYFRWRRDRLVSLIAVAAVLGLGMINGLLAAIAFSIAMLLHSLSNPRLSVLGRLGMHDFVSRVRFPHAQLVAGMLVLRPEEPLFFANADRLFSLARQAVLDHPQARIVVLSMEESPDLDATTLESLHEYANWLTARGLSMRLARLKEQSRDALQRANFTALPVSALDYSSVDDAAVGTHEL